MKVFIYLRARVALSVGYFFFCFCLFLIRCCSLSHCLLFHIHPDCVVRMRTILFLHSYVHSSTEYLVDTAVCCMIKYYTILFVDSSFVFLSFCYTHLCIYVYIYIGMGEFLFGYKSHERLSNIRALM